MHEFYFFLFLPHVLFTSLGKMDICSSILDEKWESKAMREQGVR